MLYSRPGTKYIKIDQMRSVGSPRRARARPQRVATQLRVEGLLRRVLVRGGLDPEGIKQGEQVNLERFRKMGMHEVLYMAGGKAS